MKIGGFCGSSNRSRAIVSDTEQTINLYAESRQAGTPKATPILLKRPALRPWTALPAGPVRGLYTINGRFWGVGGVSACEIFQNRTLIVRGTVALDANPVTFACNGTAGQQLMLASGGLGYVQNLTTNAFAPITDPAFPANVLRCEYLTSVGIVQVKNSTTFFYSEDNDFTSWNALDYWDTSLTADNKNGMLANHGDLWLFGTQRTEIWQNTGNQNTPFQPIQGTVIEQGSGAGFSAARLDNAIFLVQGDERGNRMVVKTEGYGFTRISTNPLEFYLGQQSQSQIDQTVGWAFQLEGHAFYVLFIPGAPFAPVYDVSTGLWFDWGHWDTSALVWKVFRPQNHVFFGGRHLVGDATTSTIYELSLDYQSDAVIV